MDLPKDWSLTPLGEIATAQYGLSAVATDDGVVPMLGMKNLLGGSVSFHDVVRINLSDEDLVKYRLRRGDILFNRTNSFSLVGKTAIIREETDIPYVFASYLVRLYVDRSRAIPEFVCYFMNSDRSIGLLKALATPGVSQYNINPTSLRTHFHVALPPTFEEQLAIVRLLEAWDRSLAILSALLAGKLRLRHGLVQQLLTGKERFREFESFPITPTRLHDIFEKVADAVEIDPTRMYQEIGIRSHGKGLFHKEPVMGHILAEKRVYRVVPDCLTLNIVFAWERALAVTTSREEGMVVSHRFPMFRPNRDRILPEYALMYMLSQPGEEALQLASPGGAGRNRTLSQTEFLKTPIPLPCIDEQRRIVEFVNVIDLEIETLQKQLAALKEQKKGLMQKLLTGEVRIRGET